MSAVAVIFIIICIIIIGIAFLGHISCPFYVYDKLLSSNTVSQLKTGDLVLFRYHNYANDVLNGCFTHIGLVVQIAGQPLAVLEAYADVNKLTSIAVGPNNVALSDFNKRVASYDGPVYVKRLLRPIPLTTITRFESFIPNALATYIFTPQKSRNAFLRLFGTRHKQVDCVEFVIDCMIELELLPHDFISTLSPFQRVNHMRTLVHLSQYGPPIRVK